MYGFFKKTVLLTLPVLCAACGAGGSATDEDPADPSFNVSTSATGSGGISPASATVNQNDSARFVLTPDSGFIIGSVSGCNGSLSGNTYTTGAVTANCTVSVGFSAVTQTTQFTVTSSTAVNGTVSPSVVTVDDGSTTQFTVTPNSGFQIASVTGCNGTLAGNTYTTDAITQNCEVSATFSLIPVATVTFTATATNHGNGAITPSTLVIAENQSGDFNVTPDTGYIPDISGSCGGSLSGSTYTTLAMTADCNIDAVFVPIQYSLTTSAGSGGSISPTTAQIAYNDQGSFTITADAGYAIDSVTGCNGSLSGDIYTTGNISADCQISASFIQTAALVSTSAGTGGSINPGDTLVTLGQSADFTIAAAPGFAVTSVTGCNGTLNGNVYTTEAITAACTISADFTAMTAQVSLTKITKAILLNWPAISGARYFQVLENPDGLSGFSQIGNDLNAGATGSSYFHSLPLTSKVGNAKYMVRTCYLIGCTDSSEITMSGIDQLIGYFKAHNTEASDGFGMSVALSADGQTLAVGAPNEDSEYLGIGYPFNVLNGNPTLGMDNNASNSGAVYLFKINGFGSWYLAGFIKAHNAGAGDQFGLSVSLNGDGSVLAVGAPFEDSAEVTVTPGGTGGDNDSVTDSGAVYLFGIGNSIARTAMLKQPFPRAGDNFGAVVSLSDDGSLLAVGTPSQDSDSPINLASTSQADSGLVSLYKNNGSWSLHQLIKAPTVRSLEYFGMKLDLSGDGNTLAVGAPFAASVDNSKTQAGLVYVYKASGGAFSFSQTLEPLEGNSNLSSTIIAAAHDSSDQYGTSVGLSYDGRILAVGATGEDSNGFSATDNTKTNSGAAYVLEYSGSSYVQRDYIKLGTQDANDGLGNSIAISGDGNTLAVGSFSEDSQAIGINGNKLDNSASGSGATFVFDISTLGSHADLGYFKASNTGADDQFAFDLALSHDGETLAVGARKEDGSDVSTAFSASEQGGTLNDASDAGAVYLY